MAGQLIPRDVQLNLTLGDGREGAPTARATANAGEPRAGTGGGRGGGSRQRASELIGS